MTSDQRKSLDELAAREGKTLAHVIREAVNTYIAKSTPEADAVLAGTFGVAPEAEAPSRDEWDRG